MTHPKTPYGRGVLGLRVWAVLASCVTSACSGSSSDGLSSTVRAAAPTVEVQDGGIDGGTDDEAGDHNADGAASPSFTDATLEEYAADAQASSLDATTDASPDDASALPPNAFTAVQVIATDGHSTLALRANGDVYAWGYAVDSVTGGYSTAAAVTPVPVKVQGLDHVSQISSRYYGNFALKSDGTVWGWGSGGKLSFGQGQDWNSPGSGVEPSPVPMLTAADTPIAHVCIFAPRAIGLVMVRSEAADGSCAPDAPKSVWMTGPPANASTGQSFFASAYAPLAPGGSPGSVLGASHVEAVFTATTNLPFADSVFARLADGRVFAFGSNDYGQLGSADGPLRPSVPIQTPGWGGVVLIAPSAYVTLGLFPDGSLLASGDASFGSLGVPASSVMQRTPSAIAGLSGVRCVAISDSPPAAFAATDEGLYYWGTDSSFLSASQGAPLLVVKGDGGRFTSLSLSSGHVAALDARGAVYTWGADSSEQLGCGSCGNQASPRLVTLP